MRQIASEDLDPRAALEAAEEAEAAPEAAINTAMLDLSTEEKLRLMSRAFGPVIQWCLEAGTVAKIGARVFIVGNKLRLGNCAGMSNEEIAALLGFRRSAVNKHAKQFTALFGVRGLHDRSEKVCEKYRKAWRARAACESNSAQTRRDTASLASPAGGLGNINRIAA